jgi:hypothetical protein
MLQTIFLLLGIYVLYKVIFDFIIPVTRATSQVRKQFHEAQQRMQDEMNIRSNQATPTNQYPNTGAAPKAGDYIEFEEIKH